jgi:MFS family permease
MAIVFGGTPIGSPIVGWIADHFGPRWALGVGAVSGLIAASAAAIYLWKARQAAAAAAEAA